MRFVHINFRRISLFAHRPDPTLRRKGFDPEKGFAMVTRMRLSLLFAVLLLPLPAVAAEVQAPHPIVPQDLWAFKRLAAPKLSPDGKTVVVGVQEWSVERNKATSRLWLVDTATGATRRLTNAKASDNSPAWSPDGRRIAFISRRGDDGAASLYVIPVDGGEAEKVLELPYGVSSPKWLPDGKSVIVATNVIPGLAGKLSKEDLAAMRAEKKRRAESKISAKVTEDRTFRYWDSWITEKLAQHLVRVDVATGAVTDLMPGFDRPFSPAMGADYELSPDGSQIALTINSTLPPYQGDLNDDVYLLPTDGSGTLINLTADNPADDGSPSFTPDGKAVVYSRNRVPYECGEFSKLWRVELASRKQSSVSDAHDYSIHGTDFSADGSRLVFTAEDRARVPVFTLAADGSGLTKLYAEGSSSALSVSGNSAVFLNATASRPDELFHLDLVTGKVRQLTQFNGELLSRLELGKVEDYSFKGAAGDTITGVLYYPPGFDASRKYPLVQLMHGGPHTMVGHSWSYRWNAHVFAAAGYVVTWVNRHGSTGHGEAFCRSINGQWGEMPTADILASTDYLLAKLPNLDGTKVAAAGGSYGGYMAAWLAGHTDRFACLINHAGVNDIVTQYGADVTNYGFTRVLGGTPWSDTEAMQRNNPMSYARNFRTPMLIIHGELDYRVPYVNGTALYGVYQSMGLPSRLVVFPDENHWILSPQNSLRWNYEVQTWLARFIGGKPTLEEPRFDAKE